MNDDAVKAFLDQFETSKRNIDKWPPWMKDSAKVACATFPKSHVYESNNNDDGLMRKTDERKRS